MYMVYLEDLVDETMPCAVDFSFEVLVRRLEKGAYWLRPGSSYKQSAPLLARWKGTPKCIGMNNAALAVEV